jgi:periplasmic protein TonB
MDSKYLIAGFSGIALLAACSAPPPVPAPQQATFQLEVAPAPQLPHLPALTLDGYKKTVAERIASASPDIFSEPLPEMFKSIVVLDITIDREGRLAQVSVRRSNGYKALENRAIESVKRAAPFAAPAFTVRGRDGSVRYLETFLFRDDGRFRIRSLVEQAG